MSRLFDEVMTQFREGRLASSLRDLRLRGRSLEDIHAQLIGVGFSFATRSIVAERNARGTARWLRLDGASTLSEADPALARVLDYTHLDGGFVRLFPHGDPRGRDAPPDGPYATKAVLFPSSPARHGNEPVTFYDIAFRVTEEGRAISKSRREAYSTFPHDPEQLASWVIAEVHLGEAAFIPLGAEDRRA